MIKYFLLLGALYIELLQVHVIQSEDSLYVVILVIWMFLLRLTSYERKLTLFSVPLRTQNEWCVSVQLQYNETYVPCIKTSL